MSKDVSPFSFPACSHFRGFLVPHSVASTMPDRPRLAPGFRGEHPAGHCDFRNCDSKMLGAEGQPS